MKFVTELKKFDNKLWGYHLSVPSDIAHQFVAGNNRRIRCTVNNLITIHCALMPYSEGYFILMNEPNVKKLSISIGDEVQVFIEKDKSEFGAPMPETFRLLLSQDEKGSAHFHNLTPGKQRGLIYIVQKVKSIDSQLNKGLAILHHLRDVKGKLDFKMLNEMIKYYNQQSRLKH